MRGRERIGHFMGGNLNVVTIAVHAWLTFEANI